MTNERDAERSDPVERPRSLAPRDALRAVAKALRGFAAFDPHGHETVEIGTPRLIAMAETIERVLEVNVWSQTPSWAEWRERVLGREA